MSRLEAIYLEQKITRICFLSLFVVQIEQHVGFYLLGQDIRKLENWVFGVFWWAEANTQPGVQSIRIFCHNNNSNTNLFTLQTRVYEFVRACRALKNPKDSRMWEPRDTSASRCCLVVKFPYAPDL